MFKFVRHTLIYLLIMSGTKYIDRMLFLTRLPRFTDQDDLEDLHHRVEHIHALADYSVNPGVTLKHCFKLKSTDEQMSCLAFSQANLTCKEESQYLFYCMKKEKNQIEKCSYFGDDLLHCLKDSNAIFNSKFN